MKKIIRLTIPVYWVLTLLFSYTVHASSIRQFSNKDGLSNSAIQSLYQDHQGTIWIGSCDGLNVFNGTDIRVYQPINSAITFSGNLINSIMEAEKDVIWIHSNYGIDRFDTKHQTCLNFPEFTGKNLLVQGGDKELFVVRDNGYLYNYQKDKKAFQKLDISEIPFESILTTTVDAYNNLWIFATDKQTCSYKINKTDAGITLEPNNLFKHNEKLLWAFAEENMVYFIDETYSLYEYDFNNNMEYYIADLKDDIVNRGEVSSIIKQKNDYYIGFKSSGLIVLKYLPSDKIKYQILQTKIQTGIFCLMKDRFQDIIWIGTDGQGVYMYFNDAYSVTDILLDTPFYQINNPVRALYYDDEQTLWIGTKGSGILRLKNYHPDSTPSTFDRVLVSNSKLTDNTVYCFAPGYRNRLWIGTENGINYYSYRTKKLEELNIIADGKTVKYVHSIDELNDSILWISTVGEGIVKVTLDNTGNSPVVKSSKRMIFDGGRMASNNFFTSFLENDSTIWFGNRGYGAYRLNLLNEELFPYRFNSIVKSQTANEIFAIHKNPKGYWLGTSSGLLHFNIINAHNHSSVNLFSNNTVHGILEDQLQHLWLSTNQGLVRFNPETNTGRAYKRENGLSVTEFSDGAFYKDVRTETLFFGGTNGFVVVRPDSYITQDYMPEIHLNGLSIFGKDFNINDFLSDDKNQTVIELDYKQNFFCIDFKAVDYISGNNYSYSYKLDEVSKNWIENGTSSSAVFSNLSPGRYTLLVKYKNNINGKESRQKTFVIRIIPPWYLSNWAYAIYFVLVISLGIYAFYRLIRRYHRKQVRIIEKMNLQKKEEIYESKLRFFTNITHEFCTPLTLIYGPCEKILNYPKADPYIRNYGAMIKQNAERMNNLIIELLQFRKHETGNHNLNIQLTPISEITNNIAESFCELKEKHELDYELIIEPDIQWNTDVSCYNKIVGNLISNAFKYTPDKGKITVELKVDDEQLVLNISNSGKGIAKENLSKIFDRYKILDSFEKNAAHSRSGLGLAICQSMVNLLNGQVKVDSIQNEITTFTVVLPQLLPTANDIPVTTDDSFPLKVENEPVELKNTVRDFDGSKQSIMVVDDDPDMLWFVSEILAEKYNILPFSNAREALENLELKQPNLIITDVMMPEMDGTSFARTIKENKLWNHIPLILLSALQDENDQIKGIESGAEIYITKPFNVKYLEKVISRLISRESELKEYYSSVLSSFKIEGSNCIHKEDQEYLQKVMDTIAKNIANPDLSVELLSTDMGYSTRQFYRKLKPITDKSPAEIIKEYRLTMAERLLLTKNLSIEEVMDRTGFNNRATFYKLFSTRFGMPPRQYREKQKSTVKDYM